MNMNEPKLRKRDKKGKKQSNTNPNDTQMP